MTVSEAFAAFEIDELVSEDRSPKTIDSYRCTCNSLLRAIGTNFDIALLTYIHIIQWKKHMHERNNTPAHMALQLRELRRVLTYLKMHGFASLDPAEIKIPRFEYRKTEWLTVEEVYRFLSVIDKPRDKALFACIFSSGSRISELLSLDRDSIVNGSAQIWGKGRKKDRDKPDTLEFDSNALALLDEYLKTRTDDLRYLFPSSQKSPITGKIERFTVKQCDYLAHKYARKAGISKRVTTHVFRHSFATDLEMNGADIHAMAKQMRHKRLETTRIYLHADLLRKKPDYDKYHTPVPIN